jgi:ubiquinone/menaquinone biosynthesis C-methylase UbiE
VTPASEDRATERIRRSYDRKAPAYDAGMRRIEGKLGGWRARLVGDLQGTVLEVGIGTGLILPHYGAGAHLTGVDLSPEMLRRARARAEALGMSADLRVMDAQSLTFDDGSFDAVVFTLSLCTIPDARAALREALRVVRASRPVRYLEHVRSGILPVALVQDAVNPLTVLLQHDHFNRRTVDLARDAGVTELREERWFLGVMSLGLGRAP